MKTLLAFCLNLLLLLVASPLAHAQAPATSTAQPGYWNTELNLTTRDYTIVRFYNGQDQLVYAERLSGICLDLDKGSARCRRRTARLLTTALQQVLRDPAAAGQTTTLLAQQLGQRHRVQRLYAGR